MRSNSKSNSKPSSFFGSIFILSFLFFVLICFSFVPFSTASSSNSFSSSSLTSSSSVVSLKLQKTFLPTNHPFNALGVRKHVYKQRFGGIQTNVANQTMGGNIIPVGIYWTQVEIGTPPQILQVAVDTGSQDLIVPAAGCEGCHPNFTGNYNPANSSTSSPFKCGQFGYTCSCGPDRSCEFSASYETCNLTDPNQICTVRGVVYTDDFTLGGLQTTTEFGIIQYQTKNFQQFFFIDGVMGFIPRGATSFGGYSAFQRLVNADLVQDIFGICLNSQNGGIITLGGTDSSLYFGEIAYTPLVLGLGYSIQLKGISVNGQSAGLRSSDIIIDSGTNVLLLPSTPYKAVVKQFVTQLCPGFTVPGVCESSNNLFTGTCFNYTQDDIKQFPTITLELNGANLNLTGFQYLISDATNPDSYCWGVTDTGLDGLAIIGDVVMQSYYTVFDNVSKKLGWAPVNAANCNA